MRYTRFSSVLQIVCNILVPFSFAISLNRITFSDSIWKVVHTYTLNLLGNLLTGSLVNLLTGGLAYEGSLLEIMSIPPLDCRLFNGLYVWMIELCLSVLDNLSHSGLFLDWE